MRTLFAAILLVASTAFADDALPRYQLPVGRKLVYSMESHEKTTTGNQNDFDNVGTIRVTVLRENPDGSRRILFRSASTFSQTFQGGKHSSPERVSTCYADITPDGRVLPNPSITAMVNLSMVLPLLPKDAAEMSAGWKHANEDASETLAFKPAAGAKDDEFVFSAEKGGIFRDMYAMTNNSTYHFDRAKGIITRVDSQTSQDYGFHNKGTGETKLQSDETIPAADAAQLAADVETFFAARRNFDKILEEVRETPEKADQLIADAKKLMEQTAAQLKTEDAKAEAKNILKDFDDQAKYYKESADRFAKIIGKPADEWSSTDIDGKPAKLADYRGKVVVMDFWYRGCGWCIRAMPQMKQLAEQYKDKPVILLSMNTDRDVADAKFVVEKMGLTYPTIKAEGIPGKFGVQGFPTLVIVDQQGVVRDVHVGYSPTLREMVGKKIDNLLASPG